MAEISFYVKQLGRVVHGRDNGSNKQSASRSCALSMVRQLFHLGVLEAYSGTLKRQKNAAEMTPFEVKLSPQLQQQVRDVLNELDVHPTKVEQVKSDQPVSLLSTHVLDDFHPAPPSEVSGGCF